MTFLVAIANAVVGLFRSFGAATVAVILRSWEVLRTGLIVLARATKDALFSGLKFGARAVLSLRHVYTRVLKPFVLWAGRQLDSLHAWLKAKLAPVLHFLATIKDHLDDFYKHYIRPIIDTIEFIRAINRVLLAFHIRLLQKLDTVLQQVEQRLEDPLLWVRDKVIWLEDWVDRIVTADGFFQRLTLIRSLERYAPDWINGFWNRQVTAGAQHGSAYDRDREYPLDAPYANGKELAALYLGQPNRMQSAVDELVPLWREAAALDPPSREYD